LVDLGSDAAHRQSLAIGHPAAPAGMLKKVIFGRKALALHEIERRDPGGIGGVKAVRQCQEIA
jgi:hypothetical protein